MNKFDISEASGGVHKHSQGAFYPIIHFQHGIGGCHDAYLLGSYFVTADKLSNPVELAEKFRKANQVVKNEIYQWFKDNGYSYSTDGIRAAAAYHDNR